LCVITGLIAGLAATSKYAPVYLAGAGAGVVWLVLGSRREYILPPVLLLLVMDGVLGLHLASYATPGSFKPVDVCVLALVALGSVRLLIGGQSRRTSVDMWLWGWSAALIAVWAVGVLRAEEQGVPVLRAALFGRDFLFFALLLPVAPALFPSIRTLRRFMVVTAALTSIYAAAYLLAAVGALPSSLVNAVLTVKYGPITRLYTPMVDLMVLVFVMSLSCALLGQGRVARIAAAVAAITGSAVVLGLTRALYAGLLAGFILAIAIWAPHAGRAGATVRRRLLATLIGILLIGGVSAIAAPKLFTSSSSPVHAVAQRFQSGISDLSGRGSNNFTYRVRLTKRMLAHLDGHWLLGLGFLHPGWRFFADLPQGSIRDTDLGLLNGLMTMGVIGTVLIYAPVVGLLALAISRSRRGTSPWSWYWFGITFWLGVELATSLTLGPLFSSTGLAMTAIAIGASLRLSWTADPAVHEESSPGTQGAWGPIIQAPPQSVA
jgi:hypothetical protein